MYEHRVRMSKSSGVVCMVGEYKDVSTWRNVNDFRLLLVGSMVESNK